MRRLLALVTLASLGACGGKDQLELTIPDLPLPTELGAALVELSAASDEVSIGLLSGGGADSNLEQLTSGQADLAIVENTAAYRPGVRTVLPLYTGVLHVMHRRGDAPKDLASLIVGKRVFAGPEGSVERWALRLYGDLVGISDDQYTLLGDDGAGGDPDVIFRFGPILKDSGPEVFDEYEFFVLDRPEDIGRGAVVDGLILRQPQLRPFIIPARTYPFINDEPVVTVGVDTLLVAREALADETVYELAQLVMDGKPTLARVNPAFFTGIRDDFDHNDLTFPVHEGARQYVQRDAPSFLERYAELGGVFLSILFAGGSGILAFTRWRSQRRKDQIDTFYAAVLKLRAKAREMDVNERAVAIAEIHELEAQAFKQLMDEDLAADESFRIFVTLVNDTLSELETSR
jgi:TRAP-type uncharacterized transport system substrate-binding protein